MYRSGFRPPDTKRLRGLATGIPPASYIVTDLDASTAGSPSFSRWGTYRFAQSGGSPSASLVLNR